MNKIQTNEIEFELNKLSIAKDFRLFKLSYDSEKYSALFGRIANNKALTDKILSTCYEKNGNNAFVLVKDNIKTECLLEGINIEECNIQQTEDVILLNLILFYHSKNNKSERNEKKISNVDGNLYSFVEKTSSYFTALKIYFKSINEKIVLNSDLTTFTRFSEFNKMMREKIAGYPKYILSDENRIERVNCDKGDVFVKKVIDEDKKNGITEFAVKNAFFKTRISHICEVYEIMTLSKYIDYFAFKTEYYNIVDNKYYKMHEEYVDKFNPIITIVDRCNDDEYSNWLKYWFEEFGYKTEISNDFGEYNVIIIPSDRKEHDELHHNYEIVKNCIVKYNIKTKDTRGNRITMRATVKTIVNQLLIKEDIKDRKIDLFNFKTIENLFKKITIYDISFDKKEKIFTFSSLSSDNQGNISNVVLNKTLNITDGEIYIFCLKTLKNKNAKVLKIDEKHFVIDSETLRTMPIIDKLYDMVYGENYTEISRKVDIVKEVYHCYLDSGYKYEGNKLYYFSNPLSPGLSVNKAMRNANTIRMIYSIDKEKINEDIIILLLNIIYTTFVRYNVYSTQPFFFKYLEEIKRMEREKLKMV